MVLPDQASNLFVLASAVRAYQAANPSSKGIRALRISSARAGSCKWAYYDVVPYAITLSTDGQPTLVPLGHASRVYRSRPKAEREGLAMAAERGAVWLDTLGRGRLTEAGARSLLADELVSRWVAQAVQS